MDIKPIRTGKDYEDALHFIDRHIDAKEGTPEEDALEVISTLIADYEDKHHAIEPPNPIEAIKFRMEQMGLTRKDLEIVIGGRSRVSEILNRNRPLSLAMIRRLHSKLDIPAHTLIGNYKLRRPNNRGKPRPRRAAAGDR